MGYTLPYKSMTVGADGLTYDSDSFYVNELRTRGADPGAVYYSNEDLADSYAKLKAYYTQIQKLDEFNSKYGTLAQFQAAYGNTFYMAETSWKNTVSKDQAEAVGIPSASTSSFQLFASKDLSAWQNIGVINGDAFVAESDTWAIVDYRSWAPELIRDPVSGLFLIYFNTPSQASSPNNKLSTTDNDNSSLQLCIGYSETPVGPYVLLTGEEYYSRVCERVDASTVKTVSEGGKTYAVYRSDIKSGNVKLTEVKDGRFLNQNGETVTRMDPLLNFNYYHVDGYMGIAAGSGMASNYPGKSTLKNVMGQTVRGQMPQTIDAHPFFDSDGTQYIYFVSGGIWVVQMKDVVTPIWSTLTKVTTSRISSIFHTNDTNLLGVNGRNMQTLEEQEENNVNEGVFVTEYNGYFYLVYSRKGLGSNSQNQKDYDVMLAVADNPFGPYVKMADFSPVVGFTSGNDFMLGTGHCSIVRAGDEFWCVYCANMGSVGRSIGADKITFQTYDNLTFDDVVATEISKNIAGGSVATEAQMRWAFANHNGQSYTTKGVSSLPLAMPYGNGPTYSAQPLPEVVTGERNVLQDDDCTVTVVSGDASTAKYINDGMFSAVERAANYETKSTADTLTVRFDFASPKKIKAILIYSAFARANATSKISNVQFTLAEKPAWYPASENYTGSIGINDLAYESYAYGNGSVRRGVSANAVFDTITVSSITVTVAKADRLVSSSNEIRLSEITVLGVSANETLAPSTWVSDGATNAFGETPDLSEVKIDAEKGTNENWTTVPVTASVQNGKVVANLQTKFSKEGLYVFLDVEDQFGVYYSISGMNEMQNNASGTDKYTGVRMEIKAADGSSVYICADSHNFVPYDNKHPTWFNGAVRKASVNGKDHFMMEIYITWEELGFKAQPGSVTMKADYLYRQNKTIHTLAVTGGETGGWGVFNKLGLSVLPAERLYTFEKPVAPQNGVAVQSVYMSYACEVYDSETATEDQKYLADGSLEVVVPFVSTKKLAEMEPVMSVHNGTEVRRYNGTKTGYDYYDFIKLELCEASDVGVLKWYVGGNKLNCASVFDVYVSSDGLTWELVNFATKEQPLKYVTDTDKNYCTAIEINRSDVKYILIGVILGHVRGESLQYSVQELSVMSPSYEFEMDTDFFPDAGKNPQDGEQTTAPIDQTEKKGCRSTVAGGSAISMITALGGAMMLRKKKRRNGAF